MGLDQTAYTKDKDGQQCEIAYWRKHNALDGWMESRWRSKGNDHSWNNQEAELTLEDIKDLEEDVRSDNLPETTGFFYGADSRFDEFKKEQTLEFIEDAKVLLEQGEKIYYECSY